jgi:hypothetical protein
MNQTAAGEQGLIGSARSDGRTEFWVCGRPTGSYPENGLLGSGRGSTPRCFRIGMPDYRMRVLAEKRLRPSF